MEQGMINLLMIGILETLYMTLVSTAIAYLLGTPLGILLYLTAPNGMSPKPVIHKLLGLITNFFRSIPFIILIVWLLPFTRMLIGTTIGPTATIVALVVASTPFVARMVESSLQEVDQGMIEAAQAMGSSMRQIVIKVLLAEAKPTLLTGCAIAITTILGYSTMAGFMGGGGLGTIAINYGYYRYQSDVMLITVILLVLIVQIFQEIGMRIAKKSDRRLHS